MVTARQSLHFIVPGPLDTRTGGFVYDRRIVDALTRNGMPVVVHELAGDYPAPDKAAVASAIATFRSLPDDSVVIVDGLAFGALPDLAEQEGSRLHFIALVHHPLAAESGLSADAARQRRQSERHALRFAKGIITTSASTAASLSDYDVAGDRIATVRPGSDLPVEPTRPVAATVAASVAASVSTGSAKPKVAPGIGGASSLIDPTHATHSDDTPVQLLCVATVTARKGHIVLVEALADLREHAWHLHCIGSITRDPETHAAVVAMIERTGLQSRITLHGELDDATLSDYYATADLFVLATHFEGYGMVFDEAIAYGLPIVASGNGAVSSTVPAAAGLVVPPDDATAIGRALARWFDEPALRDRLTIGARQARGHLRSWSRAGEEFALAVERLAA